MDKHSPEQPEEGNAPHWPELDDPELADEYKDMLRDLSQVDERTFWEEKNLARNLKEDATFAASVYFGFLLLLHERGFLRNREVADRFDALTKSFTGEKHQSDIQEQARDIRELRKYLLELGCAEDELSGRETLRRVMLAELDPKRSGWMQALEELKKDQGIEALKKIAEEDPTFSEALERFDREASERERKERGMH